MPSRNAYPFFVFVAAAALSLVMAACGSDKSAPSIDTSAIPQAVFFNDTGSEEFFLFTGRASDNTNVDSVLFSADNGATWNTAEIDSDPPNRIFDAAWSYLASSNDISAGIHTVLVRAADRDGNETTSDPLSLEAVSGSGTGDLLALFGGAADGDVIGLSTGTGAAFGDSATAFTIPVDVNLTVQGSGYGDALTSGGISPAADSLGTYLEADQAAAVLFSVGADLTVRNLRVTGALYGVHLSDSGGPDPALTIEGCLFDGQAGWAVAALDDDTAVEVEFLSSVVDASEADSPSGGGGLFLDGVNYTVTGSEFYYQSAAGAGAGVLVNGGAGAIDGSLFEGNSLAVWASGGSALINSCEITGAAYTTNGINLTGGPNGPILERNTVRDNTGYGIRIGGSATPVFFKNIITGNEEAGVLIDFSGLSGDLGDIILGDQNDLGTGFNDIYDNTHPVQAGNTEVYVTTDTPFSLVPIDAHNNYWGVDVDNNSLINARIYDNKRTPADDRAIVDPTPYRIDPQNF